jgi:tyrosyl-tRNA synthetase
MEELSVDYERGYLNSADVKMALEKAINNILEPVRDYFSGNTKAQALIMACQLQNEITGDVLKIQMQNKEMRHH